LTQSLYTSVKMIVYLRKQSHNQISSRLCIKVEKYSTTVGYNLSAQQRCAVAGEDSGRSPNEFRKQEWSRSWFFKGPESFFEYVDWKL